MKQESLVILIAFFLVVCVYTFVCGDLIRENNELKQYNCILSTEIGDIKEKAFMYFPENILPKAILSMEPGLDPLLVQKYTKVFIEIGEEYGIHPVFIAAHVMRESRFNPVAKGPELPSGIRCIGLMQIHPYWQSDRMKNLKYCENQLYHIRPNVHVGVDQFRVFLDENEGDIKQALLKYVGEVTPGNSGTYVEDILTWFAQSMMQ